MDHLPHALLEALHARQAREALALSGRSPVQAHGLADYIPHTPSLSLWARTAAQLALFDWCDAMECLLFPPVDHPLTEAPVSHVMPTGDVDRVSTPSGLVSLPGVEVMVDASGKSIRATHRHLPGIGLHMEEWYPVMGPFFETFFARTSTTLRERFPAGIRAADMSSMRQVVLGEWLDAMDRLSFQQALPTAQARLDLRGRRL
jgi:hypothetical protein